MEEKFIQEEIEAIVVIVPETSATAVSADPHPLPGPTTPPKPTSSQTPTSESKKKPEPPAEVIEVPKALPVERAEQRRMLVEMCVRALFLCLSRFPQHYKSLYRLAYFYTNSKSHQVSPSLFTDSTYFSIILKTSPMNCMYIKALMVVCRMFMGLKHHPKEMSGWNRLCSGLCGQRCVCGWQHSALSQFGTKRQCWALLWWQPSVSSSEFNTWPFPIFSQGRFG